MNSYPREVYFSGNNICVAVGTGVHGEFAYCIVMDLPSDHYDFVGPFGEVIKGLHIGQIMNLLYTPKRFYAEAEVPKDKISDYAMTVGGLYYLPGGVND